MLTIFNLAHRVGFRFVFGFFSWNNRNCIFTVRRRMFEYLAAKQNICWRNERTSGVRGFYSAVVPQSSKRSWQTGQSINATLGKVLGRDGHGRTKTAWHSICLVLRVARSCWWSLARQMREQECKLSAWAHRWQGEQVIDDLISSNVRGSTSSIKKLAVKQQILSGRLSERYWAYSSRASSAQPELWKGCKPTITAGSGQQKFVKHAPKHNPTAVVSFFELSQRSVVVLLSSSTDKD